MSYVSRLVKEKRNQTYVQFSPAKNRRLLIPLLRKSETSDLPLKRVTAVDFATITLHMSPVPNEVANQSSSQVAPSSSGSGSAVRPTAHTRSGKSSLFLTPQNFLPIEHFAMPWEWCFL
jgi:hypothetical protein